MVAPNETHAGYTIFCIAPAAVKLARYTAQPITIAFHDGELPPTGQNEQGQMALKVPKYRSMFKDNPHLIGYEGDCVHLYLQARISWNDIISYLLQYCQDQLLYGANLSDMQTFSGTRISSGPWQSRPDYYNLGGFPVYVSKSFTSNGQVYSYHMGCFDTSYTVTSVNSNGGYMAATSSVVVTDYDEKAQIYDFKWEFNHYCDETYRRSFSWPKGYWHKSGSRYIHHENGQRAQGMRKSIYLRVPTELIWKAYEDITRSAEQQLPVEYFPKIHTMPIEESFLDDLYEVFDRPSFNAIASIIEVCGSLRNAKNLSGLFKKIKKSGGIRKHLKLEGSHLLKDEKLKTASDLYLTKKYVFETTRMDIDDFFEKLSSRLSKDATPCQHFLYHSVDLESGCDTKHCIRIAYKNPTQSWGELHGFDLGLEAVWDVIPYSFVIDWFCSFGDSLESIGKAEAVNKIDVVSCTESMKVVMEPVVEIQLNGSTFPVTFRSVSYNRQVTRTLPPAYPQSPKLSNPFNHIIDGAALIISSFR